MLLASGSGDVQMLSLRKLRAAEKSSAALLRFHNSLYSSSPLEHVLLILGRANQFTKIKGLGLGIPRRGRAANRPILSHPVGLKPTGPKRIGRSAALPRLGKQLQGRWPLVNPPVFQRAFVKTKNTLVIFPLR